MARTIQSPGVQINEVDFTLRPVTVEGTGIFLAGFSNQGPIDEVLQPGSVSEFEQIYGAPTNAAESYFYQTAKAILGSSPARLITTRLPYGADKGEAFSTWKYSALVYPVKPLNTRVSNYFILTDVNVINNGGDYLTAPEVTVVPAVGDQVSQNATCTASLSSLGRIKDVTFSTIGQGYSAASTVIVLSGITVNNQIAVLSGNSVATLTFNASGGITGLDFVNTAARGVWLETPTVTFNTTQPVPPTITAVTNVQLGYSVQDINVNSGGAGYDLVPDIIFTGGNGAGASATAVISLVPTSTTAVTEDNTSTAAGMSGSNTYLFGKPTHLDLSLNEYTDLINGNIDWSNNPAPSYQSFTIQTLKNAGLIVINKAQTSVNSTFEGYYVGIIDNSNYNPATPYNGIVGVHGIQNAATSINNYINIPAARLNFSLSASKFGDGDSVSEVMENLSPFELNSRSFDDTISIGVFKLRKSIYTPDTISLDYMLAESFVGSLDYHRTVGDQNGGPARPYHISEVAAKSSNIQIVVNPHISNIYRETWLSNDGVPAKKVRFLSSQLATPLNAEGFKDTDATYVSRVGATQTYVSDSLNTLKGADALFPVGTYVSSLQNDKDIGVLPKKLERAFELVENTDIYAINLAVEGGLGTIYVNSLSQSNSVEEVDSAGPFVDTTPLPGVSALYITSYDDLSVEGTLLRNRYTSVANVFVNAAEKQRKDFMAILDPLRNIFIQGNNSKIINTKNIYSPNSDGAGNPGYTETNFSQHIYWPLRHLFGTINSSFATTYGTFAQVVDSTSNRQIWVPFSGFAAANMANVDANFEPWFAPAGFTRGVVVGVNDLGVYPKQKQRDQMYKISINPVNFFPAEGFVIFGQKTLLKKPSAFDRINVRRLFLNLEVATRDTVKYFVFEPNTTFTRTQLVNTLSPIFDKAKNTEGLYDYLIVCDERNNTPDVIDNNEMKVDIYIKPVRTAEFILVTFYATRTNQNFQELIGG